MLFCIPIFNNCSTVHMSSVEYSSVQLFTDVQEYHYFVTIILLKIAFKLVHKYLINKKHDTSVDKAVFRTNERTFLCPTFLYKIISYMQHAEKLRFILLKIACYKYERQYMWSQNSIINDWLACFTSLLGDLSIAVFHECPEKHQKFRNNALQKHMHDLNIVINLFFTNTAIITQMNSMTFYCATNNILCDTKCSYHKHLDIFREYSMLTALFREYSEFCYLRLRKAKIVKFICAYRCIKYYQYISIGSMTSASIHCASWAHAHTIF